MKTRSPRRRHLFASGYVSIAATMIVVAMLSLLMLSAYRGASLSRSVEGAVAIRVDLADKEDAILRGIVNITPNRAMRAMKSGSDVSGVRDDLSWQAIFRDALAQANGRTSIDATTLSTMGLTTSVSGNPGDTTSNNLADIFTAVNGEADYASAGINRDLGTGYPIPLQYLDLTKSNLDRLYPIISNSKTYGTLALASGKLKADAIKYPNYEVIPYPNINFGYGTPGADFVAKRNWWAFSMNLARNDNLVADANRNTNQGGKRNFVLSLYEIPSQLAISAETFANIGTHADGTAWKHAIISGGVFATRAQVDSGVALSRVAGRNGMTLGGYGNIGSYNLGGDPFTPGVREQYETTYGTSMPVYLSSEAGRSAFVPINAGLSFFDRYAATTETNVLAGTSWNDYTNGASQCAMRLDIIPTSPIKLRFSAMLGTVRMPDITYTASASQISAWDNSSPPNPFSVKTLASGKLCVVVRPKYFPSFLATALRSGVDINNSLAINVDYTGTGVNNSALQPTVPVRSTDPGVIISDCNDLTAYTKGFSLVTNLLLYIGDDFNQVASTPPADAVPTIPTPFYPPTSLFAPDIRYGTDVDPARVQIAGQMGHLGGDTGAGGTQTRLLDLHLGSNNLATPDNITVNLSPIIHPAQLPPITMKYWLVVLEERKREYY